MVPGNRRKVYVQGSILSLSGEKTVPLRASIDMIFFLM
jgi:hypothetical protein